MTVSLKVAEVPALPAVVATVEPQKRPLGPGKLKPSRPGREIDEKDPYKQ